MENGGNGPEPASAVRGEPRNPTDRPLGGRHQRSRVAAGPGERPHQSPHFGEAEVLVAQSARFLKTQYELQTCLEQRAEAVTQESGSRRESAESVVLFARARGGHRVRSNTACTIHGSLRGPSTNPSRSTTTTRIESFGTRSWRRNDRKRAHQDSGQSRRTTHDTARDACPRRRRRPMQIGRKRWRGCETQLDVVFSAELRLRAPSATLASARPIGGVTALRSSRPMGQLSRARAW